MIKTIHKNEVKEEIKAFMSENNYLFEIQL